MSILQDDNNNEMKKTYKCFTESKNYICTYIIILFYFYYRILQVHVLSLYTSQIASSTCSNNPKVHISRGDYNELFVGDASETFSVDRLQCIMRCLKRGEEIIMAAYQDSERLCCCATRYVQSVQESEESEEIYLVDFHRGWL